MGCFPGNSGMSRTKFPFVHKNNTRSLQNIKTGEPRTCPGQLDFNPSNGSTQWFLMTQKQQWPWPEQKQLPHRGQSHPPSPPCSTACRLASIRGPPPAGTSGSISGLVTVFFADLNLENFHHLTKLGAFQFLGTCPQKILQEAICSLGI